MNIYKECWKKYLKDTEMPTYFTGIKKVYYNEFKEKISDDNEHFADEIIKELIAGKVILIKNAYSKEFVSNLKKEVMNFWKNNPDTFYKMKEGCKDFHRIITPEKAKNYSIGAVKHATYFFPWNDNPCKINKEIFERWGYIKKVYGLRFDEFQKNTPKDGKVDRIQIAVYPPGLGELETHTDPINNAPCAVSGYLSSINNNDFSSGGFYCLDPKENKIDIENKIDVGDMAFFCATVKHGVAAIDKDNLIVKNNEYDWNSGEGRWFLGLYTNDSDEIKNRTTAISFGKN